jgi:FkbM family methyltransferase
VYVNLYDPRFLQVVHELLYPPAELRLLDSLLATGDTFIDIGANHGSFSIYAARILGRSGRILAVEPQPELASLVRRSLRENCRCMWSVHAIAVGDTERQTLLYTPRASSGAAGLFESYSGRNRPRKTLVNVMPFDSLLDGTAVLPGKVVVKLDAEGSEYAFLRGATRLLATRRPTIILEINPDSLCAAGVSSDSLKTLLIKMGYTRYRDVVEDAAHKPLDALDCEIQRNIVLVPDGSPVREDSSGATPLASPG